jgi:60 kDa SS-A/Ro ribonucleoprotein
MPNRSLFRTETPVPVATVRNNAGGRAYKSEDLNALAQLACTGVFNNTYYTKAQDQLKTTLALCAKVKPADVARIAVYARQNGFMKDMPVLLLTYLFSLDDKRYFYAAFPGVVDNIGQLRNFVQMVRSGVTKRRSLGSAGKRAISNLLNAMTPSRIFWQAMGTDPSLADVLKLAHVRPQDSEHDAFFAYTLGKNADEDFANLPENVQAFENFKAGRSTEVPDVPFLRLTSLNLTTAQWRQVALRMSWNQLRMNLNQLGRKGCFTGTGSQSFIAEVAGILRDPERVTRSKVLPFSLYNTVQHLDNTLPAAVRNAMADALELSVQNAPVFPGKTLVLVDSSGSMNSPVTGYRAGATTTMTCIDAAAYFGAALLKANPDNVTVVPFDTRVHEVNLNPRDSVSTIARTLRKGGGGTSISCGIDWAMARREKYDQIVIISDNESWADRSYGWYGASSTTLKSLFEKYRRKVGKTTKMICINIVPSTTTVQAPDDVNTINVGGLNDTVFRVAQQFVESRGTQHWDNVLKQVPLDL